MNNQSVPSDVTSIKKIEHAGSLSERSFAALKWNYAGVAAKILSQLVIGVVLARLLGPEPFGLYAATLLVTSLGSIVAEMGLGSALVQKKEISPEDIRAVFTRLVLAGLIVAFFVVLGAGWIAGIFNDKRLEPVMIGGALFLLFQSIGIVSSSLLKRNLEMKTVQIGQVVSYLTGFLGVGVTLALMGFGVLSLMAAFVSQSLIFSLMMYFKVRHPVRPLFRFDSSHFVGFGGRVVLTNLANWTIENMDNFLVGKLFGMGSLGLYSVAYNLVRTPTNHLMVTLQGVLFSAGARAQENDEGLQRAYLATLGVVTLVTFPVFAGAASVSGTVIEALYGEKWIEAAPLFLPLALAMPFHAAMTGSVILWAKGLVGRELKVQFWIAIVFLLGLLAASMISLTAMAWAVFLIYLLRSAWLTRTILYSIHLSWRKFGLAVRGGIALGFMASAILIASDHTLRFADVAPIKRLLVELMLGLVLLLVAPLVLGKWILSSDVKWLIKRLVNKLPGKIQPWFKNCIS